MTATVPSIPRSGRRRIRVVAAVTTALITTLTASACGLQVGAAAVVGDRRISVEALQKATTDIQAYAGAGQTVSQDKVLLFMLLSPELVRAAAGAGVGVSEDQARQELGAHKVAHPSQGAVDALRALDALSGLQQGGKQQALTAFVQRIRGLKIEINPRYGTFDPANLDIVASTPDWLITATPQATSPATPPADGGSGGGGQAPAPTATS